MKPLSETYKELGIDFEFPIKIWNVKGYLTYREDSDGYWDRYEYDGNGNQTYYENSGDCWYKREYDSNGNHTYYENSEGLKYGTPKSANQ